ncbi:MAG TPA: hypothetical protein VMV98_03370 [Acidobacteriaceae bacterium]|nr:hypothetical protein [Acidobacteriaceae bacterium]
MILRQSANLGSPELMKMSKRRKEKDSLGNIAVPHGQVGKWMSKTYEINCPLSAQEVSARIAALFSTEGVSYKIDSSRVSSTRTPIAIMGNQPGMYTHNNWVGINPFAFVSGVDVRCEPCEDGVTKVILRINRWRAFLFVAIWITCGGMAATAMPEQGSVLVFIGVSCAAWFTHVSFLGGYLIKNEIADYLKVSKKTAGVAL